MGAGTLAERVLQLVLVLGAGTLAEGVLELALVPGSHCR